jgi:hypothetical protein
MNERTFSVTKGVRLAMVMSALLLALAAGQALSAQPAEAICANYPDCGTPDPGEVEAVPPANDNFSAAKSLSWLQDGYVYGDTTYATLQSGEPRPYSATRDCGVLGISNSVWYKITPNYTGTVKFSTAGSSFDTVLGLYKGSSLTSLQQVNCSNDNSSPNWTDNMTTQVQAGQTYYLQLSGTGGARSGKFKLYADWGCYYYSYDQVLCPV